MSNAIKHITDDIFSFRKTAALVHMHCACNTVQVLRCCRLPFSLTTPPTSPSWVHWLQDYGGVIQQREW